jgi:hypothetical protein
MEAEEDNEDQLPQDSLETGLIMSIASDELTGIGADIAEVGIDSVLDQGLLKDIPILGIAAKAYSAGVTISSKLFEKKVLTFLYELSKVSHVKRVNFVSKLNGNSKFARKVGENLLILIERINDMNKPALLARVFAAFIEQKIDHEMFTRLSSVIDGALVSDVVKLSTFRKMQYSTFASISLEKQGLVYLAVLDGGSSDKDGNETGGNRYAISELGEILLSILED